MKNRKKFFPFKKKLPISINKCLLYMRLEPPIIEILNS